MEDEQPPNGRVVGGEYGVAGGQQLQEIKAVRVAEHDPDYYYPSGATEPVPIEE
jgi:hypothetical protein